MNSKIIFPLFKFFNLHLMLSGSKRFFFNFHYLISSFSRFSLNFMLPLDKISFYNWILSLRNSKKNIFCSPELLLRFVVYVLMLLQKWRNRQFNAASERQMVFRISFFVAEIYLQGCHSLSRCTVSMLAVPSIEPASQSAHLSSATIYLWK